MLKKLLLIVVGFILLLPIYADEANILPSEKGTVKSVKYVDTNDNIAQTKQLVTVRINSGTFKNEEVELENVLTGNPYYDLNLKKGTKVILHAEESNGAVDYSIEDINRSGTLMWLSLLFCTLLVLIGKKKGTFSLISIGLTVFLISRCLSPMILFGINPLIASLIICLISTALTMYLVGGINSKSTSALLGTISSLIFAGILAALTVHMAHLTGFTNENSMYLYASHPELDFLALTIAAIVLATLGAVMDVAMSIASTINEIYETDNTKTTLELFKSGMNVGRDIIGTMANTLILVYLGGSLPLLLLINNIDLQKFINLNQVVTEITAALIGSIAIIICVPMSAIIAALLIHHHLEKDKTNSVELSKIDLN